MKKPKASIIILNYLKSKRVCENVESIQQQKVDFPIEIIILDNSCNAENAEKLKTLLKFPNVQVHINEKNLGYTRGNNKGAAMAKGEYLLIVNPDIIWKESDTLQKMVDFMEQNPEVGILGPRQIDETDHRVTMTVRAFPKLFLQICRRTWLRNLPIFRDWVAFDEMRHLDYTKTQPVDWIQSSFWAIRKELWDKFRGLNEDYYVFMSDPDLCFQSWKAGYEVVYYPKVTVYADGIRASAGGIKDFFRKWLIRQHLKDAIKYQFNYFGRKNPREEYFKKKNLKPAQ